MLVEYATVESFARSRRAAGPVATPATDFTARVDLTGLPAGQRVFYRVRFEDLADSRNVSEPATGSFVTPSSARRDVSFVWGGDVCGQGWGINPEFGGLKIFEAMRGRRPDFLIHSGDTIYADGVIEPEVKLPDGSIWKNLTTPEKSKVAETLDEFRGNHRYNFLDEPLRRFNAETAVLAQWDDHEVRNNWYPGQILDDPKVRPQGRERSRRARAAGVSRVFAASTGARRSEPCLSRVRPRPAARCADARRTQLSRCQFAESPARAWTRKRVARFRAGGVDQTAPALVTRGLEGHRQRHARRHRRATTGRTTKRSRTASQARRPAVSSSWPASCSSSRRAGSGTSSG